MVHPRPGRSEQRRLIRQVFRSIISSTLSSRLAHSGRGASGQPTQSRVIAIHLTRRSSSKTRSNAIASRPKPEATEALQKLIADHAPSYVNTLKHALALQRRARRDFEYAAPAIDELRAVMTEGLPETVDDMRAYFADRIERLQEQIRGSNTDMWEAYWTAAGKPRGENFCRNRMIEHISGQLPQSIRFEPEMHMPGQTRADIAAIRNTIGLPVEIKGQWHREVWNAASDQLDIKYARDWHAEGRGVYIVLWFGNVPKKQLPRHPDGLQRPETPEALCRMLIDRLPEARRAWIDVFVVDLSRPVQSAGA